MELPIIYFHITTQSPDLVTRVNTNLKPAALQLGLWVRRLHSTDAADCLRKILDSQIACSFHELANRAWKECRIPYGSVRPAYTVLYQKGLTKAENRVSPSIKQIPVSFAYATTYSRDQTERVIDEKIRLLAKHFDNSETIGHHAEDLVAQVCWELNYTEIRTRKKPHGQHEMDVYAKHPLDYYQNIQVRNRNSNTHAKDIDDLIETTLLACASYGLDIRPALVTNFIDEKARLRAAETQIPWALMGSMLVPEDRRSLYEELNSRLSLGVTITNRPTDTLRKNIAYRIAECSYHWASDIIDL